MPSDVLLNEPEFRAAFLAHEQQERINTGRVAAVLVIFLMPAGFVLDLFVYPGQLWWFLGLRLACSALTGLVWYLHGTEWARRRYRYVGLSIALLPAYFMCWMIAIEDGPASLYYAGLNLVLLGVSAVVHWSTRQSLAALAGVFAMYVAACVVNYESTLKIDPGHTWEWHLFVNNLYFLVLTGIIVVTGNVIFNRLRFREFALRFELDRNRKQLEENNQRLLELDQAKSRFYANVSHELRTPLTLLLAPLDRLLHDPARPPDPPTRELLLSMQANGMRLLKLINDLLELVRLDAGAMQLKQEPVVIGDLLRGLVSAVRQMAEDKHIMLETSVAPDLDPVLLDRDRLEKTILNLLFNALKFTPAGGRVETHAHRDNQWLVLQVSDTGMGISGKNLGRVFDRFWQADDSTRRKYQGMGIGLALVKELTEAQGGSVSVQSAEGKGTTFTLRLPYQPAENARPGAAGDELRSGAAAAAPTETATHASPNPEWLASLYRRAGLFPAITPIRDAIRPVEVAREGHRPRALVADDEPDMLRFLKSQLQEYYQVFEAVDGQQAIDKAAQFLPDVILLDMMMPEKDGVQACRAIREHSATQNLPIIMLTARADEETKLTALSSGANDFLTKPFSTTELHVRVKHLVDTYRLQRKLAEQNQRLESTIEQLKETEIQLIQTEKIASLGRMSAGIIHEINNPLNFAATGLYTLKKQVTQLPEGERRGYAEVLRDVEEGLERVKSIVSDLRTFTHPDTEHREWVHLNAVLADALRFLSSEWKGKIRVEQHLPEHLTLWTNRNRLLQLLLNLLQNALDALRRKEFRDEEPTVWVEGRTQDHKSIVTVRDNGDGIEAKHLDRIFEPFFTTKDVGQGMGLGLSICYRIVQEHNGQVRVRSERGRFAEFTIEFPAPDVAPAGSGP